MHNRSAEIKSLQGCLNDLISVLAFPALWSGREPDQVVTALLDGLVAMLRLDFAYARVGRLSSGPQHEMLSLSGGSDRKTKAGDVGLALGPCLKGDLPAATPVRIPNPVGAGEILVVTLSLGLQEQIGLLAAGSARPDFPTTNETLLLRVAANQAAIWLQEARHQSAQKLAAEELEQRVVERTREVSAINEELLREVSERERAEQRLTAQYAVTRILAESDTLAQAAPHILRAVGGSLGLEWGALWVVDQDARVIRCQNIWHAPDVRSAEFDAVSRRTVFKLGEVLPGRVWETGSAMWFGDISRNTIFKRANVAAKEGLLAAIAFPILLGGQTLGVIEFFSGKPQRPGSERLATLSAIGSQIGQFIERKRAEEEQRKLASLVENSTDFIGIASTEGQLLFVNRAGRKMLGLQGDEHVRRTVMTDIVADSERDRFVNEILPAVMRDGRWEGEVLLRRFNSDALIPMLHHLFFIRESTTGNRLALATISRDITHRKQAEEKLRRSEANLAEGQRISHTGSWTWNVVTGECFWSVEHFHIFGLDPETFNPTVDNTQRLIHPEDLPLVEQTLERAVRDQSNFEVEYRLVRADGSIRHHCGMGHPHSNNGGELVFSGSVIDITERKEAEAQLLAVKDELAAELISMTRLHEFTNALQLETDFHTLLEAVLAATIELQDADFGHVQLFDPHTGALEIVVQQGFTKESLDYFREVREDSSASGRAIAHGKRIIIEDVETDPDFAGHLQIAKASGYRAVQSTPLISRAGDLLGVISTHFRQPHRPSDRVLRFTDLYARQVADLLEQKSVESALRRSETYLAEGQKLSHTGSWADSPSTGEIYWSREHFQICGLDPETISPTYEMFLDMVHPEDRPQVRETYDKAVRERGDYECNYRVVRPDGMIRYIHALGHPVCNESGELTEFVGTVVDTTERRLSEEALRHAHDELAHATRVQTLGEMSASIAHEVNQPLAAIVTNGHACLRLLGREHPDLEGAREAVEAMINDGMLASDVIKRIRRLLKKSAPERSQLDMNRIIQEVTLLTAGELSKNNVFVRTELESDLPAVMADRVQIQQVLINLILNGSEAMSDLLLGPREVLIRSLRSDPRQVTVSVQDSGVGLKVEAPERMFDAFYTTKHDGLGLGLSISRTIVEEHGGKLWATPNKDQGATFRFSLPACN